MTTGRMVNVKIMELMENEIKALRLHNQQLREALEAIYADGKLVAGAGEAYGVVISHQSIARRALKLTPPF